MAAGAGPLSTTIALSRPCPHHDPVALTDIAGNQHPVARRPARLARSSAQADDHDTREQQESHGRASTYAIEQTKQQRADGQPDQGQRRHRQVPFGARKLRTDPGDPNDHLSAPGSTEAEDGGQRPADQRGAGRRKAQHRRRTHERTGQCVRCETRRRSPVRRSPPPPEWWPVGLPAVPQSTRQ